MSSGYSVHHYALKTDYEAVVSDVSLQLAIKFVDDNPRNDSNFPVYSSPLKAEKFGVSRFPKSPDLTLLIFPENIELPWEYWVNRESLDPAIPPKKYLFFTEKDINRSCITFHPSGFHKSEIYNEGLLEGWIATNSQNPDAIAIFNAFKKSIKKRFEYFKHSGVYVGPEAVKYFESGGRLTQDLRQSKEGDVKR